MNVMNGYSRCLQCLLLLLRLCRCHVVQHWIICDERVCSFDLVGSMNGLIRLNRTRNFFGGRFPPRSGWTDNEWY